MICSMDREPIELGEQLEERVQFAIGKGVPLNYVAWYFQLPLDTIERLAGDDAPGHADVYEPTLAEIEEAKTRIRAHWQGCRVRRFSAEDRLKMLALRALGYTYHEIAQEMGMADGSAWSVVNRDSAID